MVLQLNNVHCRDHDDEQWEEINAHRYDMESDEFHHHKKLYKHNSTIEKLGQHILAQPAQTALYMIDKTESIMTTKLQRNMERLEQFSRQMSADFCQKVEVNAPNQLASRLAVNFTKKAVTVANNLAIIHMKTGAAIAKKAIDKTTTVLRTTIEPYAVTVDALVGDAERQLAQSTLTHSECTQLVEVGEQKVVHKAGKIVTQAKEKILTWWRS